MPRPRDERGAIALVVAVLTVVLLGMAGMAVDLGHAYVARRDVQKVVDFAALAGAAGNNLPGTTPLTCSYGRRAAAADQAVQDVLRRLGDEAEMWQEAPTAQGLVDCDLRNGEVLYGTLDRSGSQPTLDFDPYELTVVSPARKVDFVFADVLGFDDTIVSAKATAAIKSPRVSSVPLYAFTGCDYGRQTIAQPNNGHADNELQLQHPDDTNAATLTSMTAEGLPAAASIAIPTPVPHPTPLTIYGSNLANVTAVGFFEPGPGELVTVSGADLSVSAGSVGITDIPSQVTSVPGDWYVRVKIGASWSTVATQKGDLKALQLIIGEPTLTCGQGSSEGNFGSLLLSNSKASGQWQQIAMNIAGGLEHSLAVHPTPADPWTCSAAQTGAVLWPAEGTNCVDTKPGMVANAAQAGFLTGLSGTPGRLSHRTGSSTCATPGSDNPTTVSGILINNDTLSCYLTDDTTNIGTISSADYDGAPVLSPEIYNSPRFLIVPVLGRQPTNGGSNKYQIVGFRPAFVTNQANSATRTSPPLAGNGLTLDKGSIESVQVVFINAKALSPLDSGDVTEYAGTGPRVLRLVD